MKHCLCIAKMLKDLSARSIRIEASQTAMSNDISELKEQQKAATSQIADIGKRLGSVESQLACFDSMREALNATRAAVERMETETNSLRTRLDDLEDRSQRDNVVFFGIEDVASETAEQSEMKVLKLFASKLQLTISSDSIARAHRIGKFSSGRNRPLIVKFSAYKTKETVFDKRFLLKGCNVSMSEDFCATTRDTRKALYEYGKELHVPFNLQHTKLFANGKCYGYDKTTKAVYVIGPSTRKSSPASNNVGDSASVSDAVSNDENISNTTDRTANNHAASPRRLRSGRMPQSDLS